jgi:hypothetical protein
MGRIISLNDNKRVISIGELIVSRGDVFYNSHLLPSTHRYVVIGNEDVIQKSKLILAVPLLDETNNIVGDPIIINKEFAYKKERSLSDEEMKKIDGQIIEN